ncbi:MAG: hypothetical protein Q7U34_10805 [Anaerolineales bacterium]|nr:hypothetical protein [Anaerolineales bacterium]
MEQIIIRVRDHKKADTLMRFLTTLDYVENVISANLPMVEASEKDKEADFFALAGLWAGRDVSQESLRKQAWPVRS